MIRYIIALLTLLIIITLLLSCNGSDTLGGSDGIPAVGTVDSEITQQDAEGQDFNLKTPGFGMQVAIRNDVDGNTGDILNLLDERAADFLQCQFGNSQIGSQEFQIQAGEIIPPLSSLRVFVVPFTFRCNTVEDMNADCGGIYFPDPDIIVIAKESLGRCGEFPLFRHELGHRYGMALDHSNISEFQSCIQTPPCI
jgi:hypothetical protein